MKFIFLVISVFTFSHSIGQLTTKVSWTNESTMPKNEVIYYNKDVSLLWDNFKGMPNREGIVAALTVSGFGYNANIKTTNGKGELNISVYCYFNLNKSWVKPEKNTAYILTHEQHHFDISFLAAAIFMDKLIAEAKKHYNTNGMLAADFDQAEIKKFETNYQSDTWNFRK